MKSIDLPKKIHEALRAAGLMPPASGGAAATPGIVLPHLDRLLRGLRPASAPTARAPAAPSPASSTSPTGPSAPTARRQEPGEPGQTLSGTGTAPAGKRSYRLYVPARQLPQPAALVVMLHGCKQNPDDFAAGTRMNALAEEHGFLVVYPAQSTNANGSNCWNWFQQQDQQRDSGEPSIIAAIVHDVMARHAVDPARVFVAGLSAGAAMAVIVAAAYPDLFAAVGAHSGLPQGAAHDAVSAFAAMRSGSAGKAAAGRTPAARLALPTIVFHGDQDHTVAPVNGQAIAAQALPGDGAGLTQATMAGAASATSRAFTRTVHATHDGRPQVEHWTVHGGAHAWSGGSQSGSYTDTLGPDASAEMLRFFFAQRPRRQHS